MWLPGEHISFEKLVDLTEGTGSLSSEERAHLASCARCTDNLAWLERLIALAHGPAIEDPPAAAVARYKALLRERRRPSPTAPRLLQALLGFDSARGASAPGMRSEAALSRKIFLQAEGYDILLSIAPVDSRWAVTGQLLATTPAPFITGSAELLSAHDQARAALSELCEFALPPVRAGRYTLTVSLADLVIVFPDLDLGD